jgi:hypothetical protein
MHVHQQHQVLLNNVNQVHGPLVGNPIVPHVVLVIIVHELIHH